MAIDPTDIHALVRTHRSIAMLTERQMAMDREDALAVLERLIEYERARTTTADELEAAQEAIRASGAATQGRLLQ